MVDYPNSKKAKKFYLCLFAGSAVGAGESGGKKAKIVLPEGLEGSGGVQYEARRERKKERSGKRKGVKTWDKEKILKKKEVRFFMIHCSQAFTLTTHLSRSCIDLEERRTSPTIPSTLRDRGRSVSNHVQLSYTLYNTIFASMSLNFAS